MENREHSNTTSSADMPPEEKKALLLAELLKTCVFLLAAAAVLIFGTIAWFATNDRVQSSGVSVSSKNDLIRLATKGLRQIPDQEFSGKPDSGWKMEVGTLFEENSQYYYTDNGAIALRLDNANTVISPGARGVVEFYVIPMESGPLKATLHVGLGAYQERTNNGVTRVDRVNDSALNALLNGHILLFRDYSGGTYSGWLKGETSKEYVIDVAHAEKDVPISFKFYWIWPLHYNDMASGLTDDADFVTWREQQADMTGRDTVTWTSDYLYSQLFLTKSLDNTPIIPESLRTDAYNLADEFIGSNTHYLYLTIQTAAIADTP